MILVIDAVRYYQPEVAEVIETTWGPFHSRTSRQAVPPYDNEDELEEIDKLMRQAPRPGRGGEG